MFSGPRLSVPNLTVHMQASSRFWKDSQSFQKRLEESFQKGLNAINILEGEPSRPPARDFILMALIFTKARKAHLGVMLPQMSPRSICRFDEESDAIKAQASDDSLQSVAECLLSAAAALSGMVAPSLGPEARQYWERYSRERVQFGACFLVLPSVLGFLLFSQCLNPSQGHVLRASEPHTHTLPCYLEVCPAKVSYESNVLFSSRSFLFSES